MLLLLRDLLLLSRMITRLRSIHETVLMPQSALPVLKTPWVSHHHGHVVRNSDLADIHTHHRVFLDEEVHYLVYLVLVLNQFHLLCLLHDH